MKIFDIYLKKGPRLALAFEKFDYGPGYFILYDSAGERSDEGFLLFDAVSAIVPHDQPDSDKIEPYNVHLKNDQHLNIYAHVFDITKQPGVRFYTRIEDHSELHELNDIYVATSEVVAIMPGSGLRKERRRSFRD